MGRKKNRFYKNLQTTKDKDIVDTNVEMIVPGEERQSTTPTTNQEPSASQVKMSKKKQKMLDNYIKKRLQKEARPALMERLQKATVQENGGVSLISTKNLLLPRKRDFKVGKKRPFEQNDSAEEDSSNNSSGSEEEEEEMTKVSTMEKEIRPLIQLPSEIIDLNAAIKEIKKSSLNPLIDSDDESSSDSDTEVTSKSDNAKVVEKKEIEEEVKKSHSTPSSFLPPWKTFFVLVGRQANIIEQRSKLPIFAEEQRIMEMIKDNPVSILCGETGSGKTTQVPQFLYEAGFGDPTGPNPGLIGVTQPRRVAATSMARRVGEELNRKNNVSYQIRYEGSVNRETRIKFMTDGILLRELSDDFLLKKYSVILLDEAHERNLNTDILIGMLSRVVKMRNKLALEDPERNYPLRLVIMSATLNVDEFQKNISLFDPLPPLISVEARQHPVTIHFARKTEADHVEAAYRSICKIHANLPPGGILVFMTGKQEIMKLSNKLRKRYPSSGSNVERWKEEEADELDMIELMEVDNEKLLNINEEKTNETDDEAAEGEENNEDEEFSINAETRDPLHVLPLYSLLAPEEQEKVFIAPPENHRLCVLATNVAETSLTIPNIRYVVDCGLVKERHQDSTSGSSHFSLEWISKASATQRAGRAGRVGPGHCYRLYSAALYDQHFPPFSIPEIQRTPIEGFVLQLKAMGIDRPELFPLPTPPPPESIKTAQQTLISIGALTSSKVGGNGIDNIRITNLGRKMSLLPMAPIWSRLVIVALEGGKGKDVQLGMLSIALASVMAVGDPFLDDAPISKKLDMAGKPPTSDILMWLNVFLQYILEPKIKRKEWCQGRGLMAKRMEEMNQQYRLLLRLLQNQKYTQLSPDGKIGNGVKMIGYNDSIALRKMISGSLGNRLAERVSHIPGRKRSLPAYHITSLPSDDPKSYAYLHPNSILKNVPPKNLLYTELITNPTDPDVKYIKYGTAVEAAWIQ